MKKKTDEKKKIDDLIDYIKKLDEVEYVANLGDYKLNIKTGIWTSSKMLDKVFGIGKKYERTVKGWSDLLYSEDKQMMVDYFNNEVLGKHLPFDKEYRIVRHNDGEIRWVYGRGRLEFDKDNNPVAMIGTIQDIDVRKKKDLEVEKTKDEFISIASHQLRTPLAATKWLLESIVSDTSNLTAKQLEKIKNLEISNERIIRLVNYILNITRIESGKMSVNKKPTDIVVLINDLIKNLSLVKDKKLLKFIAPKKLPKIKCDPFLIKESLENIINNAILYSRGESKIVTIKIEDRKDDYLISVNNEGLIEPEIVKKMNIFKKFVRGDYATKVQPSGSGLGLYITKKVVELSGGKIWFESSAKSGTTFYITIVKN